MNLKRLVVLLSVVPLPLASCTHSPTSPNGNANLIQNPTFRAGSEPSLAGWEVFDTTNVKLVANAPTGSASWSLWLAPQFGPARGELASTSVTGQTGQAVYTLSGWERNFGNGVWGDVYLSQIRNGNTVSYKSWEINDTTWTPFAFSDTLDMLPADTLTIGFNSASVYVVPVAVKGSVDTISSGVVFNAPSLTKSPN